MNKGMCWGIQYYRVKKERENYLQKRWATPCGGVIFSNAAKGDLFMLAPKFIHGSSEILVIRDNGHSITASGKT